MRRAIRSIRRVGTVPPVTAARRLLVVVVLAVVGLAQPWAAAPARAAAGMLHADLVDPLMTAPAVVRITATDAEGRATAFTGTATLAVGRSRVARPASGDASGTALVTFDTTGLRTGAATLTVRVVAGGAARALVLTRFLEVEPPFTLTGFGCDALTPRSGTTSWAVTSLHGRPVRTPNSRDGVLLPYVASTARLSLITDPAGLPVATRGSVTLTDATGKRVARVALSAKVRALVFGAAWPARVRSSLRPGAYTATLLLTDAAGRSATAVQTVAASRAATACR